MKSTRFVSLDCKTGEARRYYRVAGNHPTETGRRFLQPWRRDAEDVDWRAVGEALIAWAQEYEPPEEEGPRPTPPLRTQKAA